MANTLTNMGDTIIVNAAIEAFCAKMTPLLAFARNVSPAPAIKGDKVKVLSVAAATAAATFSDTGYYAMQDSTVEGLDVSLDTHKYVSVYLTDGQVSENPQLNLERFGRQKGYALAKAVLQNIWSLITAANFSTAVFTGAADSLDSDDVADVEAVCDGLDWPDEERSLILKPTYHTALVKDNAIQGTLGVDKSPALAASRIDRLHNFGVYKSNLVPGNSENLVGFVCQPDAILVAMRYLTPQEGNKYFQAAPITDPLGSGITIGFRDWYDENYGQRRKVLECVYGKLKGNGDALRRFVSA